MGGLLIVVDRCVECGDEVPRERLVEGQCKGCIEEGLEGMRYELARLTYVVSVMCGDFKTKTLNGGSL